MNDEPDIFLHYEDHIARPRPMDASQIRGWLSAPSTEGTTNLVVTPREVWRSFMLWLALREPDLVLLDAGGAAATADAIPTLLKIDGPNPWRITNGIVTTDGMAFYLRQPPQPTLIEPEAGEPETFILGYRVYGEGTAVGERLEAHAAAWQAAGRPGIAGMRVRVYPVESYVMGDTAVTRRWHTFVVDWPLP
ncbi:MAG: hypothetical protein KF770_26770 [Anaerolineae bacterium]|nr:hypothetical protein [Anaerolineae bacterium]